jgi:serine/threonine protein kinase
MELLHKPGESIAQRYRIVDILGQGGSGTTYQAQDRRGQRVALKALSLHRMTDWKMMELFEREARVLAQLNHPAIPRYLEYFHVDTPQDRSFYIAQQLAPGQSLAVLVQKGWRANEEEVRRLAAQILEILVYLHELTPPVIHRDIKPQNIIRREDGQVFLVDFGAVQDTYHNTFMRGSTVVGTYGYMAPEQFRGQAVPTTDLYGLVHLARKGVRKSGSDRQIRLGGFALCHDFCH